MPDVLERLQAAVADRYRIEREAGRGRQARVFLASDLKHHGRAVAIKVFESGHSSPIDLERFQREKDVIAGLAHPYIVPLFDSGAAGDLLYFVMEFVAGESLRERLRRDGRLPVAEALRLAREAAEAVGSAHAHGVIHRDIKPENILLDAGHARLADFGIARPVGVVTETRLTVTGQSPGTPAYMSPEQALGLVADRRSDQYSLACVLYEMLTGEPPFVADTVDGMAYQHAHGLAASVRKLRPETPAAVARAIERAMSKRPADRFESMEAFAAALEVPSSWAGRPPVPAWLVPAIAVAGVGLAVFLLAQVFAPQAGGGRRPLRVAVADFRNLTGNDRLDHLGAGLSADLLSALVQSSGVLVTRGFVTDESGQVVEDPHAIARELGVGLVVTGDIRPAGDQLRLNVQIVDGAKRFVRWGRSFDFAASQVVDVRDALLADLLGRLRPDAKPGARPAPPPATGSSAAFEAYLRGLDEMSRADDPLARDRAVAALDDAIRQDSTFALAWAARARALWWLHDRDRDPGQLRLASEAADRAVRLGADLLQTRVARARVHRMTGEAAAAVAELQQVLRVNPNYDDALVQLGYAYRKLGDMERAEASLRQAVALRPEAPSNWYALGNFLLGAGHYPRARVAYERVIALQPGTNRGYEGVGNAWLQEGGYAEAIAAYKRMPRPITTAGAASNLATAHFFLRHMEEARGYYLAAVGFSPRNAELRRNLGDCYQRLGRAAEAREQYRAAIELVRADLQAAPDDPELGLRLVVAFAKAGECDSAAARLVTWAPRVPAKDADLMLELAKSHALCGRRAAAVATLREMVRQGVPALRFRDEDEFRPLRNDPGFRELLSGKAG